jgi:hypothetical protein
MKKLREHMQKADEVLANIKAVKGEEYQDIVLHNLRINLLLDLIRLAPMPDKEKMMIAMMVSELGGALVHEWERGKDKAKLEEYGKTLEADVTNLVEISYVRV